MALTSSGDKFFFRARPPLRPNSTAAWFFIQLWSYLAVGKFQISFISRRGPRNIIRKIAPTLEDLPAHFLANYRTSFSACRASIMLLFTLTTTVGTRRFL